MKLGFVEVYLKFVESPDLRLLTLVHSEDH
jgi:hypothetical protein